MNKRSVGVCGFLFLTTLVGLAASGCDVEEAGDDPVEMRAGDVLECDPSDPVPVEKGSEVVIQGDEAIAVTEKYDPELKISAFGGTKYTCDCTASFGSCNPSLDGMNNVTCLPSGCGNVEGGDEKCKLNTGATQVFDIVREMAHHRGCDGEPYSPEPLVARAVEVEAWLAKNELPGVEIAKNGKTAQAPEGYGLVSEFVAGGWLVYAAPAKYFDEAGNLKAAIGPGANQDIIQIGAMGGGGAKCYCDQKGNKDACTFSGGTIGVCAGQCLDVEQQSQCTIELKTKK